MGVARIFNNEEAIDHTENRINLQNLKWNEGIQEVWEHKEYEEYEKTRRQLPPCMLSALATLLNGALL